MDVGSGALLGGFGCFVLNMPHVIQVKLVQYAVEDGSEHEPDRGKENDTAKQSIGGGEELGSGRSHGSDGAHTSKDCLLYTSPSPRDS